MTKDDEFAEFVSARWLTLVRAALALGSMLSEAQDVAQTTLMRALGRASGQGLRGWVADRPVPVLPGLAVE